MIYSANIVIFIIFTFNVIAFCIARPYLLFFLPEIGLIASRSEKANVIWMTVLRISAFCVIEDFQLNMKFIHKLWYPIFDICGDFSISEFYLSQSKI